MRRRRDCPENNCTSTATLSSDAVVNDATAEDDSLRILLRLAH